MDSQLSVGQCYRPLSDFKRKCHGVIDVKSALDKYVC